MELYARRVNHYCRFAVTALPDVRNTKSMTVRQQRTAEGEAILRQLTDGDYVTLLDEQVDANAALAWRNFKAGTADNVLLDYSYAGYKHGEEAPADVWGLGYKVYNVVDYGADPTGVRSSRGALAALLKELKLSGRSDAGANLANANARAVIYFPEGRFVLHNDDDNVVDPTSALSLIHI